MTIIVVVGFCLLALSILAAETLRYYGARSLAQMESTMEMERLAYVAEREMERLNLLGEINANALKGQREMLEEVRKLHRDDSEEWRG